MVSYHNADGARYADATGHVPELPSWASGFWQSKLRYRTQDELRAVARIAAALRLRERLRPYIHQQMRVAAQTGLPPMRPLLPAGCTWITTGTGARHGGGTTLSVPVSIDRIPVFVREGAEVLDVVR